MIFHNPTLDSFCTSVDYLIDKNQHVGEVFPFLLFDAGLTISTLSNKSEGPTIGDCVFVQDKTSYDIIEATMIMPPATKAHIAPLY